MARKWRNGAEAGSYRPRVVVVGAGFAGLATVGGLTRAGLAVTLVDRNIYSTFQPLLYQVATGGLNPSDVAYPLRGFARKYSARFRRGELSGIDSAGRRITFADGGELVYDYLVLATGVSAGYYGVTGAATHSFGLYTRHDAIRLRDQLTACVERLSFAGDNQDLSITVVGGGATGVELAGTLAELRSIALPSSYPDIEAARIPSRWSSRLPRCWHRSILPCVSTHASNSRTETSTSGWTPPFARSPPTRLSSRTARS